MNKKNEKSQDEKSTKKETHARESKSATATKKSDKK